eukprot:TRINITY_DN2547_c2_g1_i1.p1 TRINITY_DN2547_c2_g1~~TRINITY_DN2547_c2_g1_i1.p1  ORF type:complete len:875 (-),score=186.23 TRINITY_DN2547_c2_g1_i1:492-3116(-)
MGLSRIIAQIPLIVFLAAQIVVGKKVSVKEVVFDSAVTDIQWLGYDQKTVLVQTSKGRLYRSTNGGDKWNDITDFFKVDSKASGGAGVPFAVSSITKSPADPNVVLVSGTQRTNFISTNKGDTWKKMRQRATIHTVMFHKTRPKWLLMSTWSQSCDKKAATGTDAAKPDAGPCNHMLYITKDLGKTFTLVTSYVVQFSWGDVSRNQQDRIYFTHFRMKTGDQPKLYIWSTNVDFAATDDAGKNVKRLVRQGNKFLVSHGFIFVAKVKNAVTQTVKLMVSNNGGSDWREAQLPTEIDEKSYTVLDTSEGSVMLHVNHGASESMVGNVYISDDKGVRYTLSLPNNVRGSSGDCEFDKILCLEGIYMANFKDMPRAANDNSADDKGVDDKKKEANAEAEQLEQSAAGGTEVDKRRAPKARGKEESIVRTVISFDKGGVWSYLKPPRVDSLGKTIDCPPERCWLHLHGITNFHNYAPFYSTENAVGIIMGTGNVGPYLRFEPDQTNTYMSRDGGLTWVEAHKGAFIYEYGDHGGLIVMADDIRKTKLVVFSWNEGQSWYDFELSEMPLEVDNIVTEPNATSTKFLLYGTRGDTGVMYHLDFETLGQPLCKGVWAADSVSSDYETWMPSDGRNSEKCMLGRQVTYTRRKQTSECFNGEKFERPVNRKNCACTEENYECEMGFTRKVGSMECKFADDGTLSVPDKCTSSDYFFADAYRKVIGDSCEGGWQAQKVAVPCPANSKLSRGAMSVLGSIGMLAVIMGAVSYLSSSEKFKGVFANYGFDNSGYVKYGHIGGKAPESALDSVGTRFDSDFIEGDQDDYNDAPQLMAFNAGGAANDNEPEARRIGGGIETAASAVPKLAKPPGAAAGPADDDSVDLL